MKNKFIDQVKICVLEVLKNENVKVILFGSRARMDSNYRSDIDIGIIPDKSVTPGVLSVMREKVMNLNVPYKIDIVDFSKVSDDFKHEAMKECKIWRD